MKDPNIISWIFLSLALASQQELADYRSISIIADGLNHTIPVQKELQTSIKWLIENEMIEKVGKKYRLSKNGEVLISEAHLTT